MKFISYKSNIYVENIDLVTRFRNLRKQNSSGIPTYWIYRSIYTFFTLLLTKHITLNNCRHIELESLHINVETPLLQRCV